MCNKDLFFRSFGSGKPLVILHGILGSSDIWVPTARYLSAYYRVIVPDLPNHGNSFHTKTLHCDDMAEEIEHFLHRNGIQSPIMMGHSYGGKIVLSMAAKKYIDMEKIILIDITSEQQTNINMQNVFEFLNFPLPDFTSFAEAKNYFELQFADKNISDLLLKGLKRSGKTLVWRWNTQVLGQQYSQILQPIALPQVCHIPLLLIKGEKSDYVTQNGIHLLEKTFTNFSTANVPDAGHWLHADNFDGFIQSLSAFLQL